MTEAKEKVAQYVFYFALEVAGMVLILWDGLPIYRHLFFQEQIATTEDQVIMSIAVVAIQASYWIRLRHPPPFKLTQRPFVAHLLIFVSRLSFVFASSLYALVIYRSGGEFTFTHPWKIFLFFGILFSVFCFSRHIEAIGNLLLRGSDRPAG